MNTARITAPEPVILEIRRRLEREDGEPGLLDYMVPEPRDTGEDFDWYTWRVNNWGTKWEISDVQITDDSDPDCIEFGFSSAWAPPLDAFREWAHNDGRVTYRIDYIEEGMGIVGRETYDGEGWDEEHFEQGSDPDGFAEWARAEWGWEPWEDPEPLTEWLEAGIKELEEQRHD
jgi:hypothetical protein